MLSAVKPRSTAMHFNLSCRRAGFAIDGSKGPWGIVASISKEDRKWLSARSSLG